MPRAKLGRVTLRRGSPAPGTAGARCWSVCVNGRQVGSVAQLFVDFSHKTAGWYFVVRDDKLGIPLRNTCGERGVPEEDVKSAAVAYVKQCLAARATQPSSEESNK